MRKHQGPTFYSLKTLRLKGFALKRVSEYNAQEGLSREFVPLFSIHSIQVVQHSEASGPVLQEGLSTSETDIRPWYHPCGTGFIVI